MTNGERAYALRVLAVWFERDWKRGEKQPDTDTVRWAMGVVRNLAEELDETSVWQ